MNKCPDRPLVPPTRSRWTELLEDGAERCANRFCITDPLCITCSGRDKECDRYECED